MSAFPDPIPATYNPTNEPVLLHAVEGTLFLAMLPDGDFRYLDIGDVNADFRFDYRTYQWVSTALGDDDGGAEEDDRGESLQGFLPEHFGIGDGDQGDEADHDPGNLDTSEAESE